MAKFRKSERGQIMVLLVFGIVALFGFTALAIDGSMLYSDRRYAQGVADASALAAGGTLIRQLEAHRIYYENFSCTSGQVGSAITAAKTDAKNRASSNMFTNLGNDLSTHHGVASRCNQASEAGKAYIDKYVEITVEITTQTKTSFAHLFYSGPLVSTVKSTVRARPHSTAAFGFAVVSTSTDCSNSANGGGVWFDGNGTTTVSSGGIFSNSCVGKSGTSGTVVLDPPTLTIVAREDNGPYPNVSPQPTVTSGTIPPIVIPAPNCDGLPYYGNHSGSGTIPPGAYGQISLTNNQELVFSPGLYCISGGFQATGGRVTGTDVTLYLTGGGFSVGGQTYSNLRAPQNDPVPAGTIKGLLLRAADTNSNDIEINGGSDTEFLGTIYAPKGTVEVGGNSDDMGPISCQIIADMVKLHGNIELNVNFSSPVNYARPAQIDLTN